MPKNSSRDFIERLIFCNIWYCYMKEKIFCSWFVHLNLQKKNYFALFKKKNLSARTKSRKCRNPTPPEVGHVVMSEPYPPPHVVLSELYPLSKPNPPLFRRRCERCCLPWHCENSCEIRIGLAAGKRFRTSPSNTLVGRACGRLWRRFDFG